MARFYTDWPIKSDRLLVRNPSFARGWYLSGIVRVFAGEHDLAIEHIETALRLSPRESIGNPPLVLGVAYFFKRQFDEAVPKLLLAIQGAPSYPNSCRFLAACYAHMARLDDAHATMAKLRIITPLMVPSDLPYRNPRTASCCCRVCALRRASWADRTLRSRKSNAEIG